MKSQFPILNTVFVYFLLLLGCEDAEITQKEFPYIIMERVETSEEGAIFHAKVLSLGRQEILSYGFIWSENGEGDYENWYRKVITGPLNVGEFSSSVYSDLQVDQEYLARPYIVTAENTIYGTSIKFTSRGSKTPEVLSYSPQEGFDGTLVKLEGKYFSAKAQNMAVFVKNIEAEIIRSSEDSIIFKIPASSFTGNVQLRIEVGDQELTIENGFNIFGPEINSISKTEGHSGDIVIIEGNYFTQNGLTKIYFNEYTANIIDLDAKQITVIVPTPVNSLLNDNQTEIKLTSGLKSDVYSTPFKINKSWEIKSATPFSWSYVYKSFSYNGLGYIYEPNIKSLYSYNPTSDQWEIGSSFPGPRYDNSLFVVNNNKLLMMGGTNYMGAGTYFWEFDFDTNSWTQQDDLPFSFRQATSFKLGETVVIVTNFGEVWSYEFSSKVFTRKNDSPTIVNEFAFAFNDNDNIYLITYGADWQYELNSDSWIKINSNDFDKSSYSQKAVGFYSNNSAYVIEDGVALFKYDHSLQKWILTSVYPGCRGDDSYKTIFSVNDKAYVAAVYSNFVGCSPLLYEYYDH